MYLFYAIAAVPFEPIYSKLVILNEILLVAQFATFCAMVLQPEDSRLNCSLALIGIGYVQACLFGVIALIMVVRTGRSVYEKCRNSNKTENLALKEDKTNEKEQPKEKTKKEINEKNDVFPENKDIQPSHKVEELKFEFSLEDELQQDPTLYTLPQLEHTQENLNVCADEDLQRSNIFNAGGNLNNPPPRLVRRRYRAHKVIEEVE